VLGVEDEAPRCGIPDPCHSGVDDVHAVAVGSMLAPIRVRRCIP
jgi:hypothetical protein